LLFCRRLCRLRRTEIRDGHKHSDDESEGATSKGSCRVQVNILPTFQEQ
jgi:hypothetical protein